MCDGLWDQVNNPMCVGPQVAKHSSIGSIKRDPMPLFHKSGCTVNGPKKPTLPQLVAKLEPTSSPSTSAPKAASGAATQRVRTQPASPMNVIGSGSPRKVPKARRMMRSASERSPSLNGRTETSGFTSVIVVLLSFIACSEQHMTCDSVQSSASPKSDLCVKAINQVRCPERPQRTACIRTS